MKTAIHYAVVLFIFAGLAGLGLGVTYHYTKNRIVDNDLSVTRDAILAVLPEHDNQPMEDKFAWRQYQEQLLSVDPELFPEVIDVWWEEDVYPARKNGILTGAAFSVTRFGYGGEIKTVIGVTSEGTLLNARVVAASSETPGLGLKVTEPIFLQGLIFKVNATDQHRSLINTSPFKVTQDGGEIVAVTGATISSRAVVDSVAQGLRRYAVLREILEKTVID